MLVGGTRLRAAPASCATGFVLAVTGLAIWTGLSVWSGLGSHEPALRLGEAWNTSAYYFFGIPIMATAVAIAAFRAPDRCWRWPLWLVGGHQLGLLFGGLGMQSGLSLVILALIIALLLAAVFALPALLGSSLARRYRRTEPEWDLSPYFQANSQR